MKDNEINVAVAECCGWRMEREDGRWLCFTPLHKQPLYCGSGEVPEWPNCIPNFANSRDAMASALETLNSTECREFTETLWLDISEPPIDETSGFIIAFLKAAPKQLASAFLKAKGKWRDA